MTAGRHRRRVRACRATVTRVVRAHGLTNEDARNLIAAGMLVRNTWLEWGPTDDGSPEGEAFDHALSELHKMLRRFGL